jgi:hypothetical protein
MVGGDAAEPDLELGTGEKHRRQQQIKLPRVDTEPAETSEVAAHESTVDGDRPFCHQPGGRSAASERSAERPTARSPGRPTTLLRWPS